MKKLALLGAGDLGDQIMEYVKETGMYEIVGFFDDNEALGNLLHYHNHRNACSRPGPWHRTVPPRVSRQVRVS